MKLFQCGNCGQTIEVPQGVPKPLNCSKCGAPTTVIHRINKGPFGGRRGGDLPMTMRSAIVSPFFYSSIREVYEVD